MDHFQLDLVFCLGYYSNIWVLEFSLRRRRNARNVIYFTDYHKWHNRVYKRNLNTFNIDVRLIISRQTGTTRVM